MIEFTYNGKRRMVRIEKETDTYIQGENQGIAERPYSSYLKAKMTDVVRLPAK